MEKQYECLIIGGGIAGLQAAIQMGRYKHDVLVIDSNDGRSNLCKSYRNILGWPDGVSGDTLRKLGKQQAEEYGVQFLNEKAVSCTEKGEWMAVETESGRIYEAKTLLLATGVMDRIPDIPNIRTCLGATIYVCPDCDGYEASGKRVLVLGAGKAGANMALALTHWTSDIVYINHEKSELDYSLEMTLAERGITYRCEGIDKVLVETEDVFKGVKLASGEEWYADCAFIAFGGNAVHSEIAKQLGATLSENRHIKVNPRTKETSIRNVWAAGDVSVHSEQSTIAMGEGTQAAIWIHKRLIGESES